MVLAISKKKKKKENRRHENSRLLPEIWISERPNSLHFQFQILISTPDKLFAAHFTLIFFMDFLKSINLFLRPGHRRLLLRRNPENSCRGGRHGSDQIARNSVVYQLKAAGSGKWFQNSRDGVGFRGIQCLEVDFRRGIHGSLAREDAVRQYEIGNAERVLEEFSEDVVVRDRGAATGGDRRRWRRPEIEAVIVQIFRWICHWGFVRQVSENQSVILVLFVWLYECTLRYALVLIRWERKSRGRSNDDMSGTAVTFRESWRRRLLFCSAFSLLLYTLLLFFLSLRTEHSLLPLHTLNSLIFINKYSSYQFFLLYKKLYPFWHSNLSSYILNSSHWKETNYNDFWKFVQIIESIRKMKRRVRIPSGLI